MLAEQGGAAFFEAGRAGAHHGDPSPPRGRLGRRSGRPWPARRRRRRSRWHAPSPPIFRRVNTAERVHRIRRRRDYHARAAHRNRNRCSTCWVGCKRKALARTNCWVGWIGCADRAGIHGASDCGGTLLAAGKRAAGNRALADRRLRPGPHAAGTQGRRHRIYMALSSRLADRRGPRRSVPPQDEHHHVLLPGQPDLSSHRASTATNSLAEALQSGLRRGRELLQLLGFATWVGGDMDGNPNVGAETIAASLATQRTHVIEHYVAGRGGIGASAQPDRRSGRGRRCAASSGWMTIAHVSPQPRKKVRAAACFDMPVSQPAHPDRRASGGHAAGLIIRRLYVHH